MLKGPAILDLFCVAGVAVVVVVVVVAANVSSSVVHVALLLLMMGELVVVVSSRLKTLYTKFAFLPFCHPV